MSIGSFALDLAAAGAVLAIAVSVANLAGARLDRRWALLASLVAGAAAVGAMLFLIAIFLRTDLSFQIVIDYSSRDMPALYKVSGSWAGQAGSMVLWGGLLLGAWAIEEARWTVRARRGTIPTEDEEGGKARPGHRRERRLSHQQRRASALKAKVEGEAVPKAWRTLELARLLVMLIALAIVASTMLLKPFAVAPPSVVPEVGHGLNPTLRTPLMAVHPPVVFAGYALITIPFAAALAYALLRDRRWVEISRPWSRLGWLMLTLGIGIGAMWAYDTLGWGGYWGWDPVETSSLVPWIALTAFMHAQVSFEREGGYKHLLPVLGGLAVFFVLLATFVTRSGVWSSIHAYAGPTSGGVGERIRSALAASSSLRVLYYTMWSVLVATVAVSVGRLMRTEEEEPIVPPRKEGTSSREYLGSPRFLSWATMTATVVALSFMMLLVVTILARSVSSSLGPPSYHRFVLPLVIVAALVMMVCLPMRALGRRLTLLAALTTLVAAAVVAVADPGGAGAVPWFMGVAGLAAAVSVAVSGAVRAWRLRRALGPAASRVGSTMLHVGIAMLVLAYGFSNVSANPQREVQLPTGSDTASLAGYDVAITHRDYRMNTGVADRGEQWDSFRGTLEVGKGGSVVERFHVNVTLNWEYRAYATFTYREGGRSRSLDADVVASSFTGTSYLVRIQSPLDDTLGAVLDLYDRANVTMSPWPALQRNATFLLDQYVKVSNATRTWMGFLTDVTADGSQVTVLTASGPVTIPHSQVSTLSRRVYTGIAISDVHVHRTAAEDLYVTVTSARPLPSGGFDATVMVKRIPGMAILWWGMYLAAAGVVVRLVSDRRRKGAPPKTEAEAEAPEEESAAHREAEEAAEEASEDGEERTGTPSDEEYERRLEEELEGLK